ncbi:GNAT family N-acetyltransferase [Neolewinella antarctica]|uniref:Ribosomal protein S18 acetylase RimI-like enzyme n=1 Tax=Neolewinella antarctica TaxID=442734 RepID=A0ABX0XG57_9BACT|nr:GNAT family N-acetyltransferase [Neolewinella antarctica]NJC28216.1 ribosomal protein S18 acetylase RimI-like enzyme [Neolewinella antarctica]
MNLNYRIVEATPADYDTIRKIAHATWPSTFKDILTGEQIDYMLHLMYRRQAIEQQVADGHVFLLLVEGQRGNQNANPSPQYLKGGITKFKPVGYASYQADYLPGTTKLHKVYLLPESQGKGFGKQLIDKVATIARNAGQKALRLDVNYQNKAIGVYEHVGFRKIDRHTTDIGNGFLMEDWRMELALTD